LAAFEGFAHSFEDVEVKLWIVGRGEKLDESGKGIAIVGAGSSRQQASTDEEQNEKWRRKNRRGRREARRPDLSAIATCDGRLFLSIILKTRMQKQGSRSGCLACR
jgi:hypothetical protein